MRLIAQADVEVDGLMIEDPDLGATNIYLVQKIRNVGEAEWVKANTWTKKWAEANPDAAGKGPWFRRDPRVKAMIAATGYLGLGLDVGCGLYRRVVLMRRLWLASGAVMMAVSAWAHDGEDHSGDGGSVSSVLSPQVEQALKEAPTALPWEVGGSF